MRRLLFFCGLGLVVAGLLLLTYVFTKEEAEAPVQIIGLPPPAVAGVGEEGTISPTPSQSASAVPAPVTRIQAPTVEIDAPVVSLGVLAGGIMESPHTPVDVGWYTFSARPGTEGNAVFAGHVDYINHGPAVFYRLGDLQTGDEIRIVLDDGAILSYRVVSSAVYDADNAPVQDIVGPTPTESLTLITCTGAFDQSVLEYDKRLIIRAERVSEL